MPVEDPLLRQGLVVALSGIYRHFNKSLDVVIGAGEPARFEAEPACHRILDRLQIESLALYCARLNQLFRDRFDFLLLQALKSDRFENAEKPSTLRMGFLQLRK